MVSFAEDDFDDFKVFLKQTNIVSEEWMRANLDRLKTLHIITLSFIIWDHHFRNNSPHQKFFLKEARSDCIHSILTVLIGCKKAANLLLRGIIENVLRHLYYFDHPIEFTFITQDEEYISFKDLVAYLRKHPSFRGLIEKCECLEMLQQTYKTTSKFIHAQGLRFMQLSRALKDIKFDQRFFEWYIKKLKVVASNLNLLLVLFHFEDFRSMNPEFKKVVLKILSRKNKKLLSEVG
jgi:hypothetical protein